eukprot:Nk52_evm18s236 gene=Nk52_evmTU18s236
MAGEVVVKEDHEDDYNIGDDYEDEEEMGRTSKPGKKTKRDGAKRANHNALERKRRDHIKSCFEDLRFVIPIISGPSPSRSHILNKATEYIRYLKKKNEMTSAEIGELKHQGSSLNGQLSTLDHSSGTTVSKKAYVSDSGKWKGSKKDKAKSKAAKKSQLKANSNKNAKKNSKTEYDESFNNLLKTIREEVINH